MKTVLTLSTAIAATFIMAASNALTVDQQQTDIDASKSFTSYSIAQSFTPTADAIKAIDLNMLDGSSLSVGGTAFITLHLDDPENEAIAETEPVFLEDCFNFSEGPGCGLGGGSSTTVTFEFSENISLNIGQTYVFSIHANDDLFFNVAYSYDNTYDSGTLYVDGISQPEDLAFKTYAPEATINPEDDTVLISSENTIYKYSYSGELLETIPVPEFGQWENARDIIPFSDTEIAVFNGQFNPNLSNFNGDTWIHRAFEGWSIAGNATYGGIAADERYIYLTDMMTYNGGEAKGVVRYDRELDLFERFLTNYQFVDITMGEDGLLYGLQNVYGDLLVINPNSMSIENTLDLGHSSSSRATVADKKGAIYLAGWDGVISKFDQEGNFLSSVLTASAFSDIDIRGNHILVSSVYEEQVLLYTTDLNYVSSFPASGNYIFAAFSYLEPQVQEPEPEVKAELAVSSDWNSGYCGNIVLTNTTDESQVWNVALDIDGTISSLWNGNWNQNGSTLMVSGLSWNGVLQPGQTNASVGFCANR
ncbi:cellulose binding domain-containing protein [Gilvimarinus algae]|uniref:Cellulose binding domain-containing protein n=1 Tax=Gilvimarinus algae TaxID=3058037 RepID=A0ABT8TEV7_9GAMM|nr:cellulose binding domain-containing protein [Gilvimarinus sp. SDUM040014]MDO3381613.1 cellulose binding domain-containing protein [Gilvimarinus sp. SDUM040014]